MNSRASGKTTGSETPRGTKEGGGFELYVQLNSEEEQLLPSTSVLALNSLLLDKIPSSPRTSHPSSVASSSSSPLTITTATTTTSASSSPAIIAQETFENHLHLNRRQRIGPTAVSSPSLFENSPLYSSFPSPSPSLVISSSPRTITKEVTSPPSSSPSSSNLEHLPPLSLSTSSPIYISLSSPSPSPSPAPAPAPAPSPSIPLPLHEQVKRRRRNSCENILETSSPPFSPTSSSPSPFFSPMTRLNINKNPGSGYCSPLVVHGFGIGGLSGLTGGGGIGEQVISEKEERERMLRSGLPPRYQLIRRIGTGGYSRVWSADIAPSSSSSSSTLLTSSISPRLVSSSSSIVPSSSSASSIPFASCPPSSSSTSSLSSYISRLPSQEELSQLQLQQQQTTTPLVAIKYIPKVRLREAQKERVRSEIQLLELVKISSFASSTSPPPSPSCSFGSLLPSEGEEKTKGVGEVTERTTGTERTPRSPRTPRTPRITEGLGRSPRRGGVPGTGTETGTIGTGVGEGGQPYILQLIEAIETPTAFFIVTELLATDLFEVAVEHVITEEETRHIVRSLTKALKFLHDNRIVHRGDFFFFFFSSFLLSFNFFSFSFFFERSQT
jgi:hypothetical protein